MNILFPAPHVLLSFSQHIGEIRRNVRRASIHPVVEARLDDLNDDNSEDRGYEVTESVVPRL